MSLRRDSAVLFLSEGTSAFLTVVTGFLIARFLPVEAFGRFAAAFAFAGLVAVVADCGMGLLAAREVAGSRDRRRVNEIFTWRLFTIGAACAVSPWIARAVLPDGDAGGFGAWLTPGVMLLGMADFFAWILKGGRRVRGSAFLQVTTRAFLLGIAVVALAERPSLGAVLAAFWFAGAIAMVLGPLILHRAGASVRPVRLSRSFFLHVLPSVYKIGAVTLLSVAFTRLDLLLVTGLTGAATAGLFGAAGRMVDALRVVPTVANSVLLPRFSALRHNPEAFRLQFHSAGLALVAVSGSLALGAAWLAEPILVLVLGEQYRSAAPLLRPLVWSCVPMFLNMLAFSALYALHQHGALVTGISAALALELGAIAIFVPRFGAVAAAWGRLAAETLNLLILFRALDRHGALLPGRVARGVA